MLLSRRLRAVLVLVVVAGALVAGISHKYVWIYLTRKPVLRPLAQDLLSDPKTSDNPEALLEEANRLAWLFNWPKAEPLYVRAEELFKERGDTRNEIYARVGRIRAQSENMSFVDVSEMLRQQIARPVTKSDPTLMLWCLVQKGYTDLEINAASAKRAWSEARTLAHSLGET